MPDGSELPRRRIPLADRAQSRTKHFWNWDHVFLKGLELRDTTSTGVIRDNRHASDHRPVWAEVVFPFPQAKGARE
jgi:endonuclease/exonuclease/phosphatase family metal-dependent hydrolase